ncbi:hypothetical protein [uncultured Oscillibacter sp.]|uniref:hypothetical protein n=1 Tax=uncultured Oscillibacter sp. TaxID=876091 RepID=UPI002603709D|nr:hypothetical protein [uncultured Oscillibacter sp.]
MVQKYGPHLCILLGGACWGLLGLFNRSLLAGALVPAGCYLPALGALWLAARVVGREDVRWLRGLFGGRRPPDD